jgi:hypothetical protein
MSKNDSGDYERDFPEGSNMKAPGDSEFPFGAFFIPVRKTNFFIGSPLTLERKMRGVKKYVPGKDAS